MAVRIVYKPDSLTYDDYHEVDVECFPDEPMAADGFTSLVTGDFWAVYDDRSLAGFCFLRQNPSINWLGRIGVRGSHRRRGIGRQLMQTVVDHCGRSDMPSIMLYVLSDNTAARRLYEQFGFRPTESAYQYILQVSDLGELPDRELGAVPIHDVDASSLPDLPEQWTNIADRHDPPGQYVLVFRDLGGAVRGYCRLSPGFPGCFPFVVVEPSTWLAAALRSLRPYLLPEKPLLKLTFPDDALAEACEQAGLRLNYRLFKMVRSRH